jgi:hypothetical protein
MVRLRDCFLVMVILSVPASWAATTPVRPNPAADALLVKLRTGSNQERTEALRKIFETGPSLAPWIDKAWEEISPARPAVPRSFAKTLRANVDGERDLYAAWIMLHGGSYASMLAGANFPQQFLQQNAQSAFGQFNELQRKKPFTTVAASGNDNEIIMQLQGFPFIPMINKQYQEAVVRLVNHKNEQVRRLALCSLSYYNCQKLPAEYSLSLLGSLSSKDPMISGPAATALARQGDDPKLVELLSAAKNCPEQWDAMAELLCYCDRMQTTRFLKALLDDENWHARLFGSGCLLALRENPAEAEKVLLELFASRGHEMKMEAAWILYEIGSEDARKEVIRKLYDQRKVLSQVYLGVSDWLERKPDIKKKAETAAGNFVNKSGLLAGRVQFMESGQVAIDLRDAVRLGLGEKVKEKLKTWRSNLVDIPTAPVAKTRPKGSTQPAASAKNQDRYVYSILATVLSELDPTEYHKEIARCVEVIRARQLGSGLWSYRDPTDKERDDYQDGYTQANPTDFELPQAYYAICGLESAKVHGEIPVDTEIFLKALRGILYTQNLDGGFSNYPQPSPRVAPGNSRPDLAAWGLGVVAICLRNGMLDIEQEPDLLARAFIGREAARLLLVKHAASSVEATPAMNSLGGAYPLRELAYTFGNDGLISPAEYQSLEKGFGFAGEQLYVHGYPEPADSTSPPWSDEPSIEIKASKSGH